MPSARTIRQCLGVSRALATLLASCALFVVATLPGACSAQSVAKPPAAAARPEPQRRQFEQVEMGMQFKILLYSGDAEAANRAAAAAFARIGELNRICSDYDADSELSKLSATAGSGKAVKVSGDLWNVLSRAQKLAAESDGAFDVTVGPYVKLWRRARRAKEFPSSQLLASAKASVGHALVKLDAQARTAELLKPGMRLDLGGIAVGYAIDEAQKVLAQHGVTQALIDGSGDIVVSDPPPGTKGWRVGVAPGPGKDAPPSRYLLLKNCAVTTSGDEFQFVELAGKRYSHIVDPHTGLGLTDHSAVTLVAPDGVTADTLATAVSVLGPKRGLALVEAYPGTAALIQRDNRGRRETSQSPGFAAYVIAAEEFKATDDRE